MTNWAPGESGQVMSGSKRLFQFGALALALFLCGCADFGDDTSQGAYGPAQDFTYNGNQWRVSEDRQDRQLEITAVNPRLAGMGTQAVARYPVEDMPEAEFRAAANGWFATTGRFCEAAGNEDSPGSGSYQFHYSCWQPV